MSELCCLGLHMLSQSFQMERDRYYTVCVNWQWGSICMRVMWGFQVRDYIHVMDLASGHSQALKKLFKTPDIGKGGFSALYLSIFPCFFAWFGFALVIKTLGFWRLAFVSVTMMLSECPGWYFGPYPKCWFK
jgi:hypothetical protein